jgi:hypothetical protein
MSITCLSQQDISVNIRREEYAVFEELFPVTATTGIHSGIAAAPLCVSKWWNVPATAVVCLFKERECRYDPGSFVL